NSTLIRGYDSTTYTCLGTISLLFVVGPKTVLIEFYVIDSSFQFNLLLGRLCINAMYVIPSSLHQCVKFLHDGYEHTITIDPEPFKYCRIDPVTAMPIPPSQRIPY
ncbi:hypothetical protein KI387_030347, partial [Taxus chinensis]